MKPSLAFITYLSAKYPEIQEKCRNEINQILETKVDKKNFKH
jgi:hypothetical protein